MNTLSIIVLSVREDLIDRSPRAIPSVLNYKVGLRE